ncbi:hypothetical protein IW492_03465 [Enterococcus sp. BWB1-3]|uniref:hypothetical protein n=1 Tax=Enterococcus sp. BWB1-3 TaxID=2787713 RepID=UPI00192193E7|nr:hypothetical protein [Enterococcus sp. BWB1-3]MBL1228291.1 hypothetical protein [Enterococcus sp. BWB1-3]
MVKFNEFFNVRGNEYVDIDLATDTTVFLDPNKIKKVGAGLFKSQLAESKIMAYFLNVNNLYSIGDKSKAFSLIDCSKEINATRLGYSSGKSVGKGASPEILDEVFSKIQELGKLDSSLFSQPCLIPLFVNNFGEDRFSDLITNIICKELSEFTYEICKKYDIQKLKKFKLNGYYDLEDQCWKSIEVMLPYDGDEKPIILVPREMTVNKYDFTVREYIGKVILVQKQMEHLDKKSPLVNVKWVKSKNDFVYSPPSKKLLRKVEIKENYPNRGGSKAYAIEESVKQPHLLIQYIRFVENR